MDKYTDVIRQFKKTFINSFLNFNSDTDTGKSLEKEIVKRDKRYSELLDNYITVTKRRNCLKEWHKWIFFWLVVIACGFVMVLVYKTITKIIKSEDYSVIIQSIPVIITAFVSCITSVIAIPLTITRFLFNTNEDDNIAKIIQHMKDHDMAGITLLKERFMKKSGDNGVDFLSSDKD